MGSVLNPLDWPELLQERLDPQTEGDIAVATGAHPDPNATAAERDQFAGMRSYERREYVDQSYYGAPTTNVATGGPAIGGSWLGRPIMYGMGSDGNVPPPPPPEPRPATAPPAPVVPAQGLVIVPALPAAPAAPDAAPAEAAAPVAAKVTPPAPRGKPPARARKRAESAAALNIDLQRFGFQTAGRQGDLGLAAHDG